MKVVKIFKFIQALSTSQTDDQTGISWNEEFCLSGSMQGWEGKNLSDADYQLLRAFKNKIINIKHFFVFKKCVWKIRIQYVFVIAWVLDFRKLNTVTDVSLQAMYIACAPIASII